MKKTLKKLSIMATIATIGLSCASSDSTVYFNDITKSRPTVVVKLEAKDGESDKLTNLIEILVTKSRTEGGNLCYNVYQNIDSPTKFIIYEIWNNEESLNNHSQSATLKEFNESAIDIISTKEPIEIYERSTSSMPKSSKDGLVLFANIQAIDGKEGELQNLLESLIPLTLAEEGAEHYELHRENGVKGSFMFHETWTTALYWDAHMKTPHLISFLNSQGEYVLGDIAMSRTKQIF